VTKDRKVIKPKIGVLELAKQLGNVSQACRVMGYSRKPGLKNCPASEIEGPWSRWRSRNRLWSGSHCQLK
jgi:hypothetical protein